MGGSEIKKRRDRNRLRKEEKGEGELTAETKINVIKNF